MRWDFWERDSFWKWILGVGVAIFFLSRIATLASFPIFNDESIYLQYSQLIHEDFGRYKFVSAGLNMYHDWKPPFQYWFGSIFFGLAEDPLLAGRLASFFISIFGLLGLYLFIKEFLGKKEGAAAVFLYALFPPALFFNGQFIAETFVFSLAPWMYWFFLRAIRMDKIRLMYALGGAVFGAMVLLSKQSGMVYVALSILLPLAGLERAKNNSVEGDVEQPWNWRGFVVRLGVIFGGIVLALILRRSGLSSESIKFESRFNSNWLMSPGDLLGFPVETWLINWRSVRDYYFSYYSIFILLPILYFFFATLRRWQPKRAIIGLGYLAGSTAVIFLLKGFNEYIYNTAVILFLIPILAVSLFAALKSVAHKNEKSWDLSRAVAALVLCSFVALLICWIYQDILMKFSPADYIRRSTPWAMANYMNNWSGGFGVAEAIAYVKKQKGPGLVLADPQWGNPRTALEVYGMVSPRNMQIVGLTQDFQTPAGAQAAKEYILGQPFATRLVVFSSARNEARAVWQDNVEKYLCDTKKEIQVEPIQPPIIICTF